MEYWFFKVNAGPVALLVDWIARRDRGAHQLRVSVHTPDRRTVLWGDLPAAMTDTCHLTTERTVGRLDDVAWALSVDCGPERIEPDIFPIGLFRMTDVSLVSAPLATFTGWVEVGPLRVELEGERGLVSHYWGRQLPYEWWWVSANHFDRADLAVECSVFRTSLWGRPPRVHMAYLYARTGEGRAFFTGPPALVRASGTPEAFEIRCRSLAGRRLTLRGRGREYGDLGDGIVNTLTGDLDVWEGDRLVARASGTAGLERRVSPGWAPPSTRR